MILVLRGGRVITAGERGVIDGGVVIIEDGRIAAVGTADEVSIPSDAGEVVDVKGRTILPGLIDAHTHVCPGTDAETREGINANTVTTSVLRAMKNITGLTANGITTVRDLGARHDGIFALKRAIDAGQLVGPRIIACGAAIAMTGGHGYNGVAEEADGPEAVRTLARKQLKLGAECIKVMATGGAGTPGERVIDSQMTVEEMRAAVDEAHKKGWTAAAHATYPQGVQDALEAGIDTIEHGLLLDDASIQALISTGRYFIPTLEAYQRIARLGTKAYPPYFVPKAEAVIGPHKESFKEALKAGVKMAAGTDAGGHFWPLGDLADELQDMAEFGMDTHNAILAATRNAADALQRLGDLGTLEGGKIADVLVVDGNPIDDLTALRNVWLLLKDGQVQVRNA